MIYSSAIGANRGLGGSKQTITGARGEITNKLIPKKQTLKKKYNLIAQNSQNTKRLVMHYLKQRGEYEKEQQARTCFLCWPPVLCLFLGSL